jgi:hypothetical protein
MVYWASAISHTSSIYTSYVENAKANNVGISIHTISNHHKGRPSVSGPSKIRDWIAFIACALRNRGGSRRLPRTPALHQAQCSTVHVSGADLANDDN